MKNPTDNLQRILQDLDAIEQEIQNLSDVPLETLVSVGCRLSAVVKKASDALEPIKQGIRAEALKKDAGTPGTLHFESPDGSRCTVVTPPTDVQVRKDVDMEGLRASLGGVFDTLFEEVPKSFKVCKDFLTVASKVESADRTETLMKAVKLTVGTARVYFKD